MRPIDVPTSPASDPLPAADYVASSSQHLLEGVLRVSRKWVEHLHVHDPLRENLVGMGMLVEDLLMSGDYSSDAMTIARALLCRNCHRLNAEQGKCSGRSLDQCPLLKRPSP